MSIKGYKAFNKDFKCQEFQYEEGKEYKHNGSIELCARGFHFCENPMDVLNYYSIVNSVFAEVEALGETKKVNNKNADTKNVTDHIRVVKKIALGTFIEAGINYIMAICKSKIDTGDSAQIGSSGNSAKIGSSGNSAKIGSSGDSAKIGSSGYSAQIGSSGDSAQIGSSGNFAQIGSSGYSAKIGSSGNFAQIGSSGNFAKIGSSWNSAQIGSSGDSAQIGSSGNFAQIGSSGYSAKIGSSGNSAKIGSSGYSAKIEVNGENGVCAAIGVGSKIKGKKGNWITLAEYDSNGICKCVKSTKIDGKKIKADTWYQLKNGKFSEVK